MARRVKLERFVEQIASAISAGVTEDLKTLLRVEFGRMEDRLRKAGGGGRGGRARGRGRSERVVRTPAEIEKRRSRILKIVQGEPKGISSKDVAVRMKTDPRGVGKLLAGLHRSRQVKKDGELYLPA